MNVVIMQFIIHLFLIYCIILHNQYNFVMAIFSPNTRQAVKNEFPGVVSIMRLDESHRNEIEMNHKCTGTLISRQDVLTAKHCLKNTLTEGFKVLIGSIDLCQTTEFYPMFFMSYEHWISYRQKTLQLDHHDISIIKLLKNIPQNIEIPQIKHIESKFLYGLHAQITGWGRLIDFSKPRILHTASVRIMTKDECRKKLFILEGIYFDIDDKCLCTIGDPHAVLGHGDSGGPLTFFGTFIAVSTGVIPAYNGTFQPHQINLHLNLQFYYEYIQDVITRFHMSHF